MNGKPSRDKGARMERAVVHACQEMGFAAERIPLSGAAGGSFAGDVSLPILGVDRRIECKKRATGFKQLYAWLTGSYALVIAADRHKPLVVLSLDDFLSLARVAEAKRAAE